MSGRCFLIRLTMLNQILCGGAPWYSRSVTQKKMVASFKVEVTVRDQLFIKKKKKIESQSHHEGLHSQLFRTQSISSETWNHSQPIFLLCYTITIWNAMWKIACLPSRWRSQSGFAPEKNNNNNNNNNFSLHGLCPLELFEPKLCVMCSMTSRCSML